MLQNMATCAVPHRIEAKAGPELGVPPSWMQWKIYYGNPDLFFCAQNYYISMLISNQHGLYNGMKRRCYEVLYSTYFFMAFRKMRIFLPTLYGNWTEILMMVIVVSIKFHVMDKMLDAYSKHATLMPIFSILYYSTIGLLCRSNIRNHGIIRKPE